MSVPYYIICKASLELSDNLCEHFFSSKIREELGLKPLPFEKITTSKPVQKPTEKSRVSFALVSLNLLPVSYTKYKCMKEVFFKDTHMLNYGNSIFLLFKLY